MEHSTPDLQTQIDKINQYSLVAYLKLLGYTPTHISKKFTIFNIPGHSTEATPVVNNKTNRYHLTVNLSDGGIIDLISLLFQAKPEDILVDIVSYRLDQLMSITDEKNAGCAQ